MKRVLVVAVVIVVFSVSAVAAAVGPWPGLARSVTAADGVRFTATRSAGATTVKAVRDGTLVATATFRGDWGIPAITSVGAPGGLSPDGHILVLAEQSTPDHLRTRSLFLVLSTADLSARSTIVLEGEFGFDVLSPNARWLYLIQHTRRNDLVAYRVRAYDLLRHRLLPGTVVAKGESATMRGYPVARATSKTGTWVYTLYTRGTGKPFVHALDASRRYAVCIDLRWESDDPWLAKLKLSSDDRRLFVRSKGVVVATIDTHSFTVS